VLQHSCDVIDDDETGSSLPSPAAARRESEEVSELASGVPERVLLGSGL
jgi:hypothetical protein